MLDRAGQFFFRSRNLLFPVILGLLVLAAPPRAFGDPAWDAIAVAGLIAMALGQTLRIVTIGLDYIKRGGKDRQVYADRLVVAGVYAHCRNPMYVGNLLIAIGMLAVVGHAWTLIAGSAFFVFVYAAIVRSEETYLASRFGASYAAYRAASPRWIPRVRGLLATLRAYRFDWPAVVVKEYGTLFTTLMFGTAVLAYKSWRAGDLERFAPVFLVAALGITSMYLLARWAKKGLRLRARGAERIMPQISDRRRVIDDIDDQILVLLNKRARQVMAIYEAKRAACIGRIDPVRTEQILCRLESRNRGPLSSAEVRSLYGAILTMFAQEFMGIPTPGPIEAGPVEARVAEAPAEEREPRAVVGV